MNERDRQTERETVLQWINAWHCDVHSAWLKTKQKHTKKTNTHKKHPSMLARLLKCNDHLDVCVLAGHRTQYVGAGTGI